jgi:hypothetical protein
MNADERGECGLEIPDPERQVQARRYARLRRRLIPINLGLGLAWLLGLLFSGAAIALRQTLSDLTASRALVVTLFSGVVGVGAGAHRALLSNSRH